jgi:hypothetical protein
VLLFLPLGAALSLTGLRRATVVVTALLLSSTVEALQLLVPGRHASVGDLTFDSLGALVGALLPPLAVLAARGSRASREMLCTAFVATAIVLVTLPVPLSRSARPEGRLHVRLRPDFGHLALLPGEVLDARAGTRPLADTILMPGDPLGMDLAAGSSLNVRFALHAPPDPHRDTGLLRIHDDRGHEVVYLGLRGDRLLHRERQVAGELRLESPAVVTPIPRPATGPVLEAWVTPTREGTCQGIAPSNGAPRDGREGVCGQGLTPGSGWRFIADPPELPNGARALLSMAWVMVLVFPIGLTGPRPTRGIAAGGGVLLAMLWAGGQAGLLAPSSLELLAVPVGFAMGSLARGALLRVIP